MDSVDTRGYQRLSIGPASCVVMIGVAFGVRRLGQCQHSMD